MILVFRILRRHYLSISNLEMSYVSIDLVSTYVCIISVLDNYVVLDRRQNSELQRCCWVFFLIFFIFVFIINGKII